MFKKAVEILEKYYIWIFCISVYVIISAILLTAGVGFSTWQFYLIPVIVLLSQLGVMILTHIVTWREATQATVDKLGEHFNVKLQGELRAIIRKIMEEGMSAEDIKI
jgi:uncharacterized membrane protein